VESEARIAGEQGERFRMLMGGIVEDHVKELASRRLGLNRVGGSRGGAARRIQ
jgi:hypothetical protein